MRELGCVSRGISESVLHAEMGSRVSVHMRSKMRVLVPDPILSFSGSFCEVAIECIPSLPAQSNSRNTSVPIHSRASV